MEGRERAAGSLVTSSQFADADALLPRIARGRQSPEEEVG